MTRPALRLLTALALLLQAAVGLSPARAMTDVQPAAMCHAGDGTASDGTAPVRSEQPIQHNCLACPICAATTTPVILIPPAPALLRSGRVTAAVHRWESPATPPTARLLAHFARGPPRLA